MPAACTASRTQPAAVHNRAAPEASDEESDGAEDDEFDAEAMEGVEARATEGQGNGGEGSYACSPALLVCV
jgi:hypothetical protein